MQRRSLKSHAPFPAKISCFVSMLPAWMAGITTIGTPPAAPSTGQTDVAEGVHLRVARRPWPLNLPPCHPRRPRVPVPAYLGRSRMDVRRVQASE